ncbi:hypothetical protein EG68_10547 [Paragonimus skrjabini miyazakii]|uniref:Ras-related GTP-binding protein n=1 Tax=Paragonimus skrjabini miyazakii TaxID=59628 RepID=A0A8S9YBH1_9TREM|nr:hypothetical protein EG68_10547 [Paragonimus skrjabini miyazakii]
MLNDDPGYPSYSGDFEFEINPELSVHVESNSLRGTVDEKPKILLLGLPSSGKSSIQRVVFHKMAPTDTLFLESTHKIEKNDVSDCSFIKFQIWDVPGHFNICDPTYQTDAIFLASSAIIFVIDAQDDYHEALSRLHTTLDRAFRCNVNTKFEVFIHKVDCLNDDQKIDIQRDITQRVMSAVEDWCCDHAAPNLYIGYNSMVDKAFLFDVASKIYLATDSSVVDMQTYELCCDMIDVVVDVASIYTPHFDLIDPPFSEQTGATIMLNNDTILYLRGINQYMALACLMHEESMEKMGLIEYNFQIIKEGLQKMLEVSQQRAQNEHATVLAQYYHSQQQHAQKGAHTIDPGELSDVACEDDENQLLPDPTRGNC